MATSISFAGNSLQSSNIITGGIKGHNDMPTRDAKMYALSHSNASKIPFSVFPNRVITVDGTIVSLTNSITDLDSQIDLFKSYLSGVEQNLDIGYTGGTRRFVATVNSMSIDRPQGLVYAKFSISFDCSSPFGQDTSSTTALSASGRTSSSYYDTYTFLGTAPIQRPVWTITYSALSASANAQVSVGNSNTGQAITIGRTWGSTDVLVVDTSQKIVTVNGLGVVFSGAFPEFVPGSGTMYYVDYFTSRTFSISVVYTTLYL